MKRLLTAPLSLPCGQQVHNRIMKSAMSENLSTIDHNPSTEIINLYRVWSASEAGILVTGNVMIDRNHIGEPRNVVLDEKSDLNLFHEWSRAAKVNSSKLWMQINHPGRQIPNAINSGGTVAPSAVPFMKEMQSVFKIPRALEHDEIVDIINKFARTALLAKQAGFDGVQIHAAHGYLVSQFLSPKTNKRTDNWGGDFDRRMNFLRQIYLRTREAVGPDFPIGLKLNSADFQQGGITFEDSISTAVELAELGIDLIEVSGGTYEKPSMTGYEQKESTKLREAYFAEYTKILKKSAPHMPIVLTGGFRSSNGMEECLASNVCDMVGVARPMAIDPKLPENVFTIEEYASEAKYKSLGVKFLDHMAMLEITWYTQQLKRMSKGKLPKPSRYPWTAFLLSIVFNGRDIFQLKRARAA